MSHNKPDSTPSLDQIKSSLRNTWMAGDFGVIAKTLSGDADGFVARLDLPAGSHVLDVATGTGNLALPLARSGCLVTGLDLAPNLLVQARERAAAEGLTIAFDEGDAEALPYPDATFDAVVTMFGAMFAPRPDVAASELARVVKPGGILAMANWNPASFTGKMFKVGSTHNPPPPTVQPPVLWGDELTVRNRLSPFFTNIQTTLIPLTFDLPFNPAGAVDFFRQYFGPTQVAFSRLDEPGQQRFATALEVLWSEHNTAPDPTTQTLVPNQYLQVVATRVQPHEALSA